MTWYSLPSIVLMTIAGYTGFLHVWLFKKKLGERYYLYFSFACFAIAFYNFFSAGVYNSDTPLKAMPWQRGQLFAAALLSPAIVIFISEFAELKLRRLIRISVSASAVYILFLFFTQLGLRPDKPFPRHLAWLDFTYHEMELGIASYLFVLFLTVEMIYLFVSIVLRQKIQRKPYLDEIVIALSVFFITVLNDIMVAIGALKFIYLSEYGFVFLIMGMSMGIFDKFVLLRKEVEELNSTLEVKVRERAKKIEKMQAQLFQREKMAGIGQLAAGVAHEINNPSGFIISNLQVLGQHMQHIFARIETEKSERGHDADFGFILQDTPQIIEETLEGAKRIKRIVADLKSFTHPAEKTAMESDINEEIQKALSLVFSELKYKCTVKKEFEKLPIISCYPQELEQVFINMLVNSAQAMDGFGEIIIRTRQRNESIFIEIEDNGKGIGPEHLEKIFNPFFTTKPIGEGSGLGLSVSYGIVEKHGGEIKVESMPGRGTTFFIRLPLEPCRNSPSS